MDITYNGVIYPENMLTFSDVHNILKIKDDVVGTLTSIKLTIEPTSTSTDGQYYLTLLGETVTTVANPSNASNKRFYVGNSKAANAIYLAKALSSCPSIAANYYVYAQDGTCNIVAKIIGLVITDTKNMIQTNIPQNKYTVDLQNGTSTSKLLGSRVVANIMSDDKYVTTLEKTLYGGECAFDMSQVLSTISEYGKTKPYSISVSALLLDGGMKDLGKINACTTNGYIANSSSKYITLNRGEIALNTTVGDSNIIFYTYDSTIPFSILRNSNIFGVIAYTVNYKDSTKAVIHTESFSKTFTFQETNLVDDSISIPANIKDRVYYVDIVIDNKTYTFNVIKPLKTVGTWKRVYWRNEYGGIQFFDFTSAEVESHSFEIETYEKNIFDYYEDNDSELKKIYKSTNAMSIKLKSHIMERDGRWVFNSLERSKRLWVEENGIKRYIIPNSVEVTEEADYNGLYTATLKYQYSEE